VTGLGVALGVGAYHTAEVVNLFEETPGFGAGAPPSTADPVSIVKPLQAYYTNFVRFLNPNGPTRGDATGLPVPTPWPTFNTSLPRLLIQADNITVETVPQGQRDRCASWISLALTLQM